MEKRKPLAAEDWIGAGFRALALGGPQAIRAEAIARDLKVSKGSFYWHFKDVPDLKSRMLEHWQMLATAEVITSIDESSGTSEEQLRLLVEMAADDRGAFYGGVRAEQAIRDWARYDDKAASLLDTVDKQRLEYVRSLFRKLGVSSELSAIKAAVLYGGLVGLQDLTPTGLIDLKRDLRYLLEQLLN